MLFYDIIGSNKIICLFDQEMYAKNFGFEIPGGTMRKFALPAIMILLAIINFNCSKKTDLALRYDMEKELAKADRASQELFGKNKTPGETEFAGIIDNYKHVAKMVKPAGSLEDVNKASADKKQAWAIADLANMRIGIMYYERKIYDKAYDYFKAANDDLAISKVQKNAVLNYLGLAKERAGQFAEAAQIYAEEAAGYRELITPINPNMDALETPIRVAKMWLRYGDQAKFDAYMDSARAYYDELIRNFPRTPLRNVALGKIAASYMIQNNYPQALEILRATKNDTTGLISPQVMLMIGDIYLKNLKDPAGAEKTYRDFIKAYANDKNIAAGYLGLGLTLYEQDRYRESREAVKKLDKRPSDNKSAVIEGHYLTALCFEKEGNWGQALGRFNFIQATYPGTDKSFESALYIANYYKAKGEPKLAADAFQKAENYINKYTNPETSNEVLATRALGYLVKCYIEEENFPKAIETLSMLHEKHDQLPEGKLASLRLADLCENVLHDTAKAVQWLDIFIRDNPDADNIAEVEAHRRALGK